MSYKLNDEQRRALSKERRELCDYFIALTELFEKEHPELRLTWRFTIDAQPRVKGAAQGLTEGRLVHYVDQDGRHEAAVVIEIFDRQAGYVSLRNLVDMQVYATTYSERAEPNTWHWIERV